MAAGPGTLTVKLVPEIDEEALLDRVLEVISGHTVVRRGETLVIRALAGWTPYQAELYQEALNHGAEERGFPVLVVLGDELAIAEPGAQAQADEIYGQIGVTGSRTFLTEQAGPVPVASLLAMAEPEDAG